MKGEKAILNGAIVFTDFMQSYFCTVLPFLNKT